MSHLVVGTGGVSIYPFPSSTPPSWSLHRETGYGFMSLTVYANRTLYGAYIRSDGVVRDRFFVHKTAPSATTTTTRATTTTGSTVCP